MAAPDQVDVFAAVLREYWPESGGQSGHVLALRTQRRCAEALVKLAEEFGPCIHRPPSPGQKVCSCGHQQIEMEYAERIEKMRGESVRGGWVDEVSAVPFPTYEQGNPHVGAPFEAP